MWSDRGVPLRSAYLRSLDELWDGMAAIARLDAVAIERASRALIEADQPLAESVITDEREIAARAVDLEDRATELIMLQAPVASDLRLVMSTVTMAPALARMGGLARHVALTARLRSPAYAVVEELHNVFAAMGDTAVRMAQDLATVLADRDVAGAVRVEESDSVMDGLHRSLFARALAPGWSHGAEPAIDAALLGRFYERFADQAVTVARRVRYIVTGTYPTEVGGVPLTPR